MSQFDWLKSLFQGMFGISSLFYFFYLVPLIISDFFIHGLDEIPTIIALSIFPIGFGLLFFIKLSLAARIYVGSIGKLLLSIGLLLQGLVSQFDFNKTNISVTILSVFVLSFGFGISILDLSVWMQRKNFHDQKSTKNELIYSWGIGLIIALFATINLLTQSKVVLFFCLACWYLISPLVVLSEKYWMIEQKEKEERFSKESLREIIKNSFKTTSIISLSIISFIFWIYTSFTYPFAFPGWGILGVSIGFILCQMLSFFMRLLRWSQDFIQFVSWIIIAGLIMITSKLWLQDITQIATSNYEGFGLISGIILGWIVEEKYRIVNPVVFRHRFFFGLGLLFLLILETGGIAAGVEIAWIVKKHPEYTVWGWQIIGGIEIFALLCFGLSQLVKGTKTSQRVFSALFHKENLIYLPPNRIKKGILCSMLVMGILLPLLGITLQTYNHSIVSIQLPQIMYTINGTPVLTLDLNERSAKILLYEPNPVGISHSETIRPGKSVRLGGYYYGLGNTPKSNAIDWIGTTQDVYSLGMCEDLFQPSDIEQIQMLNPNIKFYYMAFATTLFENPMNNFTNGIWHGSHYPSMKFNDTMEEWTLKYENGTEAFGVRRKPTHLNAHLMDLGRSEWADYFAWIYTQKVQEFNADGVAIDEVMWRGYWDVDIKDLRDYSNRDQIISTCYSWLERLSQKTDMDIITQAFWHSAQQYQHGTWGEIAFRCGGQYGNRVDDRMAEVWYEKNDWEGIVEDLQWHGYTNRTYIWAAWYERNDVDALEYAIATYLMGKPNGNTQLVFHPQPIFDGGYGDNNMAGYAISTVQEELSSHSNLFELEMGDALEDMQLIRDSNGAYFQRQFSNGIVFVNPFHAHIPGFRR